MASRNDSKQLVAGRPQSSQFNSPAVSSSSSLLSPSNSTYTTAAGGVAGVAGGAGGGFGNQQSPIQTGPSSVSAAAATSSSAAKKLDQIVQNFYSKVAHVIIEARQTIPTGGGGGTQLAGNTFEANNLKRSNKWVKTFIFDSSCFGYIDRLMGKYPLLIV